MRRMPATIPIIISFFRVRKRLSRMADIVAQECRALKTENVFCDKLLLMEEAEKNKTIEEVLSRSVFKILPSKEDFERVLKSGRRLRIYIGADATAPSLHLGNATNFMVLERLRKLGHEVIVLFGDFTARIGDPTDKESARQALSKEQVLANIKNWRSQVGKVLSFKDKSNPARVRKNSSWLSKLSIEKIIELNANFTLQQMVERDMFEKRISENKPVYLHEFYYPLMQGYDSVAMDVDVEIGGSDQLFNMLVGRQLQKKYNNKEKFVLATTLLTNPKTGKKLMSKSEGSYIAMDDCPENMFGKTMALPDEIIIQMFTDCTNLPMGEIEVIKTKLAGGMNPRDAKLILAEEVVKIYHGKGKAKKTRKNFLSTFSDREVPKDAKEIIVQTGALLSDVLLSAQIVESKSDFKRLIDGGAVRNMETDEKIPDQFYKIEKNLSLKIGKHRFIRIKLQTPNNNFQKI